MVGVDIPSDAGITAVELAERLREHGVLVGTTGPGGRVLKIRPPLIWQPRHVEIFLGAFAAALG
jgi:4-aminobutyrate aminotransferase-like enzyme